MPDNMRLRLRTRSGTAVRGRDYEARNGIATVRKGTSRAIFRVRVRADHKSEGDETFFVDVSGGPAGWVVDNEAMATIADDERVAVWARRPLVSAPMPHNVPAFEFSDDAKQLRALVFEFWCTNGRAPTLREVHEQTGFDRRRILEGYKQLQLGIVITVDEDTQNGNLLKAPPFSSFPSQVRAYIDDKFHSFVGCASEAIAFSHMPPFKDKTVRLESHCACCLAPVTLISKNFELQSVEPPGVMLHISLSPYEWNNVDMIRMCDSMNYVIDAAHAERYERQTSSRGVLVNLDQAKMFVSGVANERMWNHDWKPGILNPKAVIKGFQMMGVDTSVWGE